MSVRLFPGDCRTILPTLAADSVHCVVTSPPYWGLRDYGTATWDGGDPACDHAMKQAKRGNAAYTNGQGEAYASNLQAWGDRDVSSVYRETCGKCGARRIDAQLGLEATPEEYVAAMVAVFRAVRRVLRADGTLWLNMGDSYANAQPRGFYGDQADNSNGPHGELIPARDWSTWGLKPKDLAGMPWRLAFALQADGWYLRADIIWAKPNPMPESVTDRPTKAHEYVFLLTKSARYFYDADAVREPSKDPDDDVRRIMGDRSKRYSQEAQAVRRTGVFVGGTDYVPSAGRNLRTVWSLPSAPFPDAHFATFPPALAQRCILAGSRMGDTVLDPFAGTGTVGAVAEQLGRHSVLIELSPSYVEMAHARTAQLGLFAQEATPA